MKTGIKIISKQSKKHVSHIVLLLETINKEKISNEVAIQALKTYTDVAEIKNMTIRDCVVSGVPAK